MRLIPLVFAISLGSYSVYQADQELKSARESALSQVSIEQQQAREVMYLPDIEFVNLISFGYRNMLAKYLWFSTLDYFGKHHQSDQDYRWLYHRCELLTRLDHRNLKFYDFCANLISWEAEQPAMSIKILDRAIEHHPNNWRFWYLRGFTYMYFLEDQVKASHDLLQSTKLPGVHPVVARLAAKKYDQLKGREATIKLLEELVEASQDPTTIEALSERLEELKG